MGFHKTTRCNIQLLLLPFSMAGIPDGYDHANRDAESLFDWLCLTLLLGAGNVCYYRNIYAYSTQPSADFRVVSACVLHIARL